MHVQWVKPLARMIGADEAAEININEGATVKDLIDKIVELYGKKSREVMLDSKKQKIKIIVLVDGKRGELETKLSEKSKIVLMMPYSGG